MMKADKIAEIIREFSHIHPISAEIVFDGENIITALADEMEADNSLCFYKMRCQHAEHDFDRTAWVAKATP